jgi:hypothetical protein
MERGDRGGRNWDRGDRGGRVNRLLPFGMWWKNPGVVTRIGLSAEQQKRIDDLFLQSRLQLIHQHASLQEEQLLLEPLLDATPFDDALSIRGVLTADQWDKLRNRDRSQRGPGGAMGGRGQQGSPEGN